MALLTDGTISRIDELSAYDSQLLTVANSEGIDVTQKLLLAKDELLIETTALLARMGGWGSFNWLGQGGASGAGSRGLRNVVVTQPVKLWHTFRALELVYRDAFNSQLNERYAGKRDEYAERTRWAHDQVIEAGLGMVWKPIPAAGIPNLQAVTGSTADGTYYVAVSWLGSAGEEGASSTPGQIKVASCSFEVRTGTVPDVATGWNIFAGNSPTLLTQQNAAPLEPGTMFRFPDAMLTTGRAAGNGQAPDYVQPVPRMIQRG